MAFLVALGMAATVGALNGVSALGAWIAKPPAVATVVEEASPPPTELETPEPPPPAFVFDAPLPGRTIDSPFGLRQLPWEENGRLHQGVDIAAPAGAPVKASADGVVKRTGVSPTYGRFVEVMHKGGMTTLYAHLKAPARGVKQGAYVRRGATVAFVGNSGRSTGSHLHFEIRKGDKPLNPAFFMGRSFAEADDLPIRAAGRVSKKVRLAVVSKWPDGVKGAPVTRTKSGRVRTRIAVSEG
ncbi:M23 family peptidase [Caulobacter segnis]|uniref:Peptidase M23 n=2 Tax=Caulobacter segnis TaxID=88688 RepID=D5VEJ1_CAUST|nr:M23 family metallopeptidase [Caulobacter segnis]ADG09134.1 Peptidase M23 [Caulobacter segnis ATCC 21756]AVQ00953.1 M23 family peptidase [Caulobacter segnis]